MTKKYLLSSTPIMTNHDATVYFLFYFNKDTLMRETRRRYTHEVGDTIPCSMGIIGLMQDIHRSPCWDFNILDPLEVNKRLILEELLK